LSADLSSIGLRFTRYLDDKKGTPAMTPPCRSPGDNKFLAVVNKGLGNEFSEAKTPPFGEAASSPYNAAHSFRSVKYERGDVW
jgi:hypothetical protein